MARINLLPWRDEYRQEKQKEFLTILVGVAVVAAFCAYLWVGSVQSAIDEQKARNGILQGEIAQLQERVKEIDELRSRRAELLDRMSVIQGLQGERPVIVRYFDELVRAVPEGIYLTGLSRSGSGIQVSGITESNVRVSALMRNLNDSPWFGNPNLKSVKAEASYGEQASEFEMTFQTDKPVDEAEDS